MTTIRILPPVDVRPMRGPRLDGAPGGTLASYQILANALKKQGATVDLRHPTVCFVPSVSAVDILGIDRQDDLYAAVNGLPADDSGLDEFTCSSTTTGRTEITTELCDWILERLPG